MIYKNCDGKIPEPGEFTAEDKAILAATDALYAEARAAMDKQALTRYLDAVWSVIADANRYFAAEEPWAKKKTDPKRMETILYVTAEIVRQFGILAQPAMPELAGKLLDLILPGDADARSFANLGERGRLVPGAAIPEPQGVFPRYVDPEEQEKQQQPPKQKKAKGEKPQN
jgi:methionyl-tRNA synthetase